MLIDQLIRDLRRPLFNYNMSLPSRYTKSSLEKSMKTRHKNAKKEIHDLVMQYAKEAE